MHSLDHVHEEPELEVQVEETNPELAQGKAQCIPPIILVFSFKSLLYSKLDCALSL
jgi:hypothetical protein